MRLRSNCLVKRVKRQPLDKDQHYRRPPPALFNALHNVQKDAGGWKRIWFEIGHAMSSAFLIHSFVTTGTYYSY